MANMDYTTRAQLDRIELYETHGKVGGELTERGRRIVEALDIFWIAIALALVYAATQVFDGWGDAVFIGVLVVMLVSVASWIYSLRPSNPLPRIGTPSRGCSDPPTRRAPASR